MTNHNHIEPHWIDCFEALLRRCALHSGETAAILCESQSRIELIEAMRHACARIGAQAFTLSLPTRPASTQPPTPIIRSTGASTAIAGIAPVIQALAGSHMVIDCTVEGLMHAPELPAILKGNGTNQPRVIYVSNEHPEALCRLLPDDALEQAVKAHSKRLRSVKKMHVSSSAGTDLHIGLEGAPSGGNWGYTAKPGTMTHFPGGLVLAFPQAGSVNGRLVLGVGDVNLAFKRYIEQAISLTIENDHITRIEGSGVDAQLMREYLAAWEARDGHKAAYAVSHIGYGLHPAARFDSMAMFDKRDFNGTELRCAAGSFLYSTGANETAGRYTLGHFDLPMKHCTITLDEAVVVNEGRLA
ncbi:peptidase M29 [Variovorax sp. PCZ-1]|uniref:peptidase M29 n=1 Tax=Variovorax sp. PCZ-1 TaxID=2835533 RepID=UPI001BCD4009|nr:peptidase M29 [Variovorax sp. PCZ-1]MBS7808642.1 peptidase M29 [Variovorax sp. PCZ-1]